jgi:hypothetical protein
LLFIQTAIDAQKRGVDVEQEFRINSNLIRAQLKDKPQNSSGSRVKRHVAASVVKGKPLVNSILIRKTYQWNLKSSLLFVISVATTIG